MDVLDSDTATRVLPTSRLRPPALAWAVLLGLVLVVPDVRQDGLDLLEPAAASTGPGTASIVLAPGPAVVGRTSGRPWDGVLVLHLEAGAALLQASAAAQSAAVGPAVSHSWGHLQATLDGVRCSGTFGWRSASGDPYGGGHVDLACDDGADLTGELRTYDRPQVEDAAWSGILDLTPSPS